MPVCGFQGSRKIPQIVSLLRGKAKIVAIYQICFHFLVLRGNPAITLVLFLLSWCCLNPFLPPVPLVTSSQGEVEFIYLFIFYLPGQEEGTSSKVWMSVLGRMWHHGECFKGSKTHQETVLSRM